MMDLTRDPYAAERERMIEHQLRARGVVMGRVLQAVREVPRHLFVSHKLQGKAYADEALPTTDGQTISQPYVVAVMTQELDAREGMQILEVGTGTGYQTAILAHLVGNSGQIYTIETSAALAASARHRLVAMAVENVQYFVGDGSAGWPQKMQFDRIMVTAAAPGVPDPLVNQLKIGGIMVLPVGDSETQMLRRIIKREDGQAEERDFLAVRFVPLVGEFAWKANAQNP